MKYRALKRQHPDFDPEVLEEYAALAAGGRAVRKLIKTFLVQNEFEPKEVYERRCREAYYTNYAGPMVGYFKGYLFTSPSKISLKGGAPLDKVYQTFKESCDADGSDFDSFMSKRFAEALTKGAAYWRVNFPDGLTPGMTIGDRDAAGLGLPTLVAIPTENIVHWKRDTTDGPPEDAPFLWLVEHEHIVELVDFEDDEPTTTLRWTRWHRDEPPKRWEVVFTGTKKIGDDDDIPEVDAPADIQGECPIVELRLPPHLWLMQHVGEPQVEHFRQQNALSWALKRSAFTMPVFSGMKDKRKAPKLGTGRYLMLAEGEKLDWPGPSQTPFDIITKELDRLKDEAHRVAQQMARGIDNNAAAIGRSGESKEQDAAATEVVLREYGRIETAAEERTLQKVAKGRGDDITFHVGGRDSYHLVDANAIAETALVTEGMKIPSRRYYIEKRKRMYRAEMPDLPEDARQEIDGDIEKNAPSDKQITQAAIPPPPVEIGKPGDVGGAEAAAVTDAKAKADKGAP